MAQIWRDFKEEKKKRKPQIDAAKESRFDRFFKQLADHGVSPINNYPQILIKRKGYKTIAFYPCSYKVVINTEVFQSNANGLIRFIDNKWDGYKK